MIVGEVRIAPLLVLCVVLCSFVLFVLALCLVPNVASTVDYLFCFIVPSIFSNIYLLSVIDKLHKLIIIPVSLDCLFGFL